MFDLVMNWVMNRSLRLIKMLNKSIEKHLLFSDLIKLTQETNAPFKK